MAKVADYGLMLWNAKSIGTLSNVIELIKRDKKCVVFVNRDKAVKTIASAQDPRRLTSLMTPAAKSDAEDKIDLSAVLGELENHQLAMPV